LLYFFGPYIEVSVLVPQDMVSAASNIIENYIGADILVSVRSPYHSVASDNGKERT